MTAGDGDRARDLPVKPVPGGVRLAVRLTPRAGRNRVDGLVEAADGAPALKIRVAAPPVDGAANAALIDYLAEVLPVAKSQIRIHAGATGRLKIVAIAGDPDLLIAAIRTWIGPVAAA